MFRSKKWGERERERGGEWIFVCISFNVFVTSFESAG